MMKAKMDPLSLLLGVTVGSVVTAVLAKWFYGYFDNNNSSSSSDKKRGQGDQVDKDDDEEDLAEVLFFPDSAIDASMSEEERIRRYKAVLGDSRPLAKMIQHLEEAKKSVDVCVYMMTSESLARAVLCGVHSGVKVRLIVDDSQLALPGSQVKEFYKAGAEVRSKASPFLMHHKFAIVDGKKLLTGSFNWTMKAVMGNRENVLVTTQSETVGAYKAEFEKLWAQLGSEDSYI